MINGYKKFLLTAALLPAATAFGGVFVVTDDACPADKGVLEVHYNAYGTNTSKGGYALNNEMGLEAAYGVTDTLEASISLNFGSIYQEHHADYFNCNGISMELKNEIANPEKEDVLPFGAALVAGFSWNWSTTTSDAARKIGFKAGVNFQKNLLDGDLLLVFTPNVSFGSDYSYSEKKYEDGTIYELACGASYKICDGFRLGAEAWYDITYHDNFEGDDFYCGPNVCFEVGNYWCALVVAPHWFATTNGEHEVILGVHMGYAF